MSFITFCFYLLANGKKIDDVDDDDKEYVKERITINWFKRHKKLCIFLTGLIITVIILIVIATLVFIRITEQFYLLFLTYQHVIIRKVFLKKSRDA